MGFGSWGFPAGFSSSGPVLFPRRVDFQSMHSLRRAGVWPPLLGLRFFLRPRESNRRAGRLIASAGAAGQHVAETGQPSFELQRPPMPPLLLRRRMVVMRARRGQQARRGGLCPALLDAHAIHSQQVSAAASEAWLRSHLRAKCPGSRVLHKPVSRSVGTYAVATIRGSSGSSRDSALDEPTRTPRRCARARACRRF